MNSSRQDICHDGTLSEWLDGHWNYLRDYGARIALFVDMFVKLPSTSETRSSIPQRKALKNSQQAFLQHLKFHQLHTKNSTAIKVM